MEQAETLKSTDKKFCSDCGSTIRARAEICPKCGIRQAPPPNPFGNTAPNGKSKIATALFAFFLGGLGAHKFYLGQIGQGFLYLAFCWTLIPAVVSIVEFILFLTMSDKTFNQKYGSV